MGRVSRTNQSAAPPVKPFRAEDLQRLLAPADPPCVSIYLPTHRRHPDWKQDPVRFRSLIAEADSLLKASRGARDSKDPLESIRRLLDEPHWEFSLDGLAVFQSATHQAAYRLPIRVSERVVVADTFHTKPLIRFLHTDRRYFVIALSQNAVSLYEGSSFGAGIVELHGVPGSLREVLGVADHDRAFSAHGGGAAGFVFHGRGPGREETKESLLKYFRAVDRGLRDFLRDERSPLLLASVKYYHPIYREANSYPHLLAEGLEGNYERANVDQIHAEAWPIVGRAYEGRAAEWIGRYRALAGTGLALDGLEEIAAAAMSGRVRCALAAEGETLWGVLDRRTGAVTRHDQQTGPDDGDLVDDLCEEALKRGADVYVIPRSQMPTGSPIAAILRF
jgi:hypothetical protein